jgi:hypothetical protein
MTEMRVVVGSGPSAVAVTHALLQRGFEVTMLDIGETLDPQTEGVVARMAAQEPEQWDEADKAVIQRVDFDSDPAVSPKRLFGSTYAYFTDPNVDAPQTMRLYGSRAFGGLSVVWGCALLRAMPGELAGWPPNIASGIFAGYPKIRDLVQRSIGADIFASGTHLRISAAAEEICNRYRQSLQLHDDSNVYPTPLVISNACKACNACMYGCVYGYTYSSQVTVRDVFMQHPRFRYVRGVEVDSYAETETGVEVRGRNAADSKVVVTAKQLFIAAGMMASLRILWNSTSAVSRVLELRDSSYFLMPGLVLSGWRGGARHHGLSHLSVDLQMPPFATKPAHVQLYFNNPAVADGLKAKLGPFNARPVLRLVDIVGRLVVAAQGYLHSDFCHRLKLQCDDAGVVHVSLVRNPETEKYIDAALSQFVRRMRKLGAYFVKPAASVTPYGASKTAGALPHAAAASPSTTDPLGRPVHAKNVFVVDTTVMVSIPARNVTLTTMANALRIGEAA